MNDIKATVAEQLRQLQMLMHRAMFLGFVGGRVRDPFRGQGRVLAMLKLKPEISQKELTYLLDMSKQALAELLAKLERSGYITREPSAEDKRAVTIRLTDAGRAAAGNAEEEPYEISGILDCLSGEELAAFSDSLGRIIERYEQLFPGEDFDGRRRMMEDFMARNDRDFGGIHGRPGFGGCREGHGPGFRDRRGPGFREGHGPDFHDRDRRGPGFPDGRGPGFFDGPDRDRDDER